MTGAAQDHREVAGQFAEFTGGVNDWDAPSPVAGWRARDVVGHLTQWFPAFLESGTGIVLPTGPSVTTDPVGAWAHHAAAVQSVLDDPATSTRTLTNPHLGTMPLEQAIANIYTGDVFLHTWDLARATGQQVALDPARCSAMLAGMEQMDEVLRSSGQYGPKVAVPDDADPQTRLMGFIGRDPLAWQ
ncbi:MAG: hypothetical protein JWR52_1416 [Marmoricola sp.]|nr:hypothetical protein [Marmoricola sp.]